MKKLIFLITVMTFSSQIKSATNVDNVVIAAATSTAMAITPLVYAGMHVHFPKFVAKNPRLAALFTIPISITAITTVLLAANQLPNLESTNAAILKKWNQLFKKN